MGIFSSLRNAFNPDSIAMSQALLAGDYGAVGQMSARRQQLAAQQAQAQREAELAQQQRDDQVWGLKESGVGNPLIASMSASDASQLQRERYAPYTGSPGGRHVMPSLNGGADTVDATPTTMQQEADALGRVNPALRESYLAKQALSIVNGTDEQGRPTIQALDPRTIFTGQFAPMTGQPPQAPQAPQPQPSADIAEPPVSAASPEVPPREAPMFSGSADLTLDEPGATVRGVQFGNPLANMPNLSRSTRNAPRRSAQPQGIPLVRTASDYNRLPRGAQYRLPDGSVRRKR